MEYTDRLQLIKPAPTDEYDILQFNENADKIESALNAALYEKTATGAGIHITNNAGTTIRITNDNASAVNAIIDGIDVSIPAGSTVDYPAADSGVTISRQVIIASNADITAKWFVSANDTIDELEQNAVNLNDDQNIGGLKTFDDGFGLDHATNSSPKWICDKIEWSSNSYMRTVIPLCCLDNTNPSANFFCMGTIHINRNSGISLTCSLDVNFRKVYNSEKCSWSITNTIINNQLTIRAVTFMYNGLKYAGIQKTDNIAPSNIAFTGIMSNPELLSAINYYDSNTDTILNSEIYNSINYLPNHATTKQYFYTPMYMFDNTTDVATPMATLGNIPPSSPTAGGTAGQMAVDNNHLYVCTATNTWRRVALSTW